MGNKEKTSTFEGYLFDLYHFEDSIYMWLIDDERRFLLLKDTFYPEIYADGPPGLLAKFVKRLTELNAIKSKPFFVERLHFYENRPVKVLKIQISRPSVLRLLRSKLFAFYSKMDIYHSDLEVPMNYMYAKNLYPLARLKVRIKKFNRIVEIKRLDNIDDLEFSMPPFKTIQLFLKKSHRLPLSKENPLVVLVQNSLHFGADHFNSNDVKMHESGLNRIEIDFSKPHHAIKKLNSILEKEDPDIILSAYGDQAIFPQLFEYAQKLRTPLFLDRDITPYMQRKITRSGSSYTSYGNTIFRAPSYPLFGRWHIDSANSFVMKESRLMGVIELSRLTRFPVQRLARSSTGIALTYLETRTAMEKNYLVPWQKSRLEEEKSAYDLLVNDKGGLIFQPDIREGNAYENIVQLDYSQMYPSIMAMHNISPETVNCLCCKDVETPKVPEINYRLCVKRKGVVSVTLASLLERRFYYKKMIKKYKAQLTGLLKDVEGVSKSDSSACDSDLVQTQKQISDLHRQIGYYESRQGALKWMLVTSFGYLGYRNAKFGKLESHEAVTAFGREKILRAKEIAESRGYRLIGAIVDCLFLQKNDRSMPGDDELSLLCDEITNDTGVQMSIDALFSWAVFFSSVRDEKVSVANRYMGRYQNYQANGVCEGGIKYRGVALRRKDTPTFIKKSQKAFLEQMQKHSTLAQLKKGQLQMDFLFKKFENDLLHGFVPWKDLLIRKSASKEKSQYSVANATYLAMEELESEYGVSVQAGEKFRFLVINGAYSQKHELKEKRYLTEEKATRTYGEKNPPYDVKYYRELLFKAYKEIWGFIAEPAYFRELEFGQKELF